MTPRDFNTKPQTNNSTNKGPRKDKASQWSSSKPLNNRSDSTQSSSAYPKAKHKPSFGNDQTESISRKPSKQVLSERTKLRLSRPKPIARNPKRKTLTHKDFSRIGHHLKPLVTVSEQGLSEQLITEAKRRLQDHELIKVKFCVTDRNQRKILMAELADATQAQIKQCVGKTILLFKYTDRLKPKLSNLERYNSL